MIKFFHLILSCIQIGNTLVGYCWHVGKAVYCCAHAVQCSSALGSTLYWVGADVHGPCYGWSMHQALAMLLVPDIPLTDKKQ